MIKKCPKLHEHLSGFSKTLHASENLTSEMERNREKQDRPTLGSKNKKKNENINKIQIQSSSKQNFTEPKQNGNEKNSWQ